MAKRQLKVPKLKMTAKQLKGVENLLSGKFKSKEAALRAAGYRRGTTGVRFFQLRGVQDFLRIASRRSKKIYKMNLPQKIVDVYIKGLGATKLFGKEAVKHPDFHVRKEYADAFAEMMGLRQPAQLPGSINQFNFFSVPQGQQQDFNQAFSAFLRYARKEVGNQLVQGEQLEKK